MGMNLFELIHYKIKILQSMCIVEFNLLTYYYLINFMLSH